jgi:hypothetical protein
VLILKVIHEKSGVHYMDHLKMEKYNHCPDNHENCDIQSYEETNGTERHRKAKTVKKSVFEVMLEKFANMSYTA